jgi:hypothetical protein
MKHLRLFENFTSGLRDMENLSPIDVENYIYEWVDDGTVVIESCGYMDYTEKIDSGLEYALDRQPYAKLDLFGDEIMRIPINRINYRESEKTIEIRMTMSHPTGRVRGNNLDYNGYIKSMCRHLFGRIKKTYDVNIFCYIEKTNWFDNPMGTFSIFIQERPKSPKNESVILESTLLIIDVQKSFKKFFTELYVNQLKKYAAQFTDVYQVFDNHVDGKNVDTDYLYDKTPESQDDHHDTYDFPNQKDVIEKRYNYNVSLDFFKEKIDKKNFDVFKTKEKNGQLRIGDMVETKLGTKLVFIKNNHIWFECPKKLYDLFCELKNKEVVIVGGSDNECLQDIFIAGESMGVKMKRDWRYIYSATHCPF